MRLPTILLAMALLLGCASAPEAPSATAPRFEEVDAEASFPVSVPTAFASRRGYLVVPEDRSAPDGRTIRLPVAIVKAADPDPDLPPVLYLAGGPGVGSLAAAAYPGAYPWTSRRDFVVLGQRGTDHADPALLCRAFSEALGAADTAADPAIVAAAAACRDDYAARGIDTAQYHSAASAADVEDLRRALGIDTWSLYGISYGTRLALTVARDYPGTVTSMVLDSVLPHTARYDDDSAANYRDALAAIAADCARQAPCAAAFPDLGARYFAAVAAATTNPLVLEGDPGTPPLTVTAQDLGTIVRLTSASDIAAGPLLMDAAARGDGRILRDRLGPGGSGGSDSSPFAWGMRLSVWCSEALPFAVRADGDVPADSFAGLDSAVVDPAVCRAWGVPAKPPREVAATVSDVPTLLIAGEYDPLTPPRWAAEAAATLSRSRVVVVRAGTHSESTNWDGDGCAMTAAAGFLADPKGTLAAGDPPCLAARTAPEFLLEAP